MKLALGPHRNDDAAATLVPFVEDTVSASDELLQGLRSQHNLVLAMARRGDNMIAAQFKFGRFFREITVRLVHLSRPSPTNTTERFGNRAHEINGGNFFVRLIVSFLPTVTFARPTAAGPDL